jgi:hypothetical protein
MIAGNERVIQALGSWPTFHDAEVIAFSAERAIPVSDWTRAILTIHVRRHQVSGAGTADYELRTTHSVLIRFAFEGACDFDLVDFNHQNVINAISMSELEGADVANKRVEIDSIWGFGGSFRCRSGLVESVEALPL